MSDRMSGGSLTFQRLTTSCLRMLGILLISGCATTTAPPATLPPGVIAVKPGETLYRIAQRHQRPVGCIQRTNPQLKPDTLDVGQRIRIPSAAECGLASNSKAPKAAAKPVMPAAPKIALPSGVGQRPWPLKDGQVAREFGTDTRDRLQPMLIQAKTDKTARAINNGTVQFADNMRQLGRVVIVHHDHNIQSVYAQCGTLAVRVGQRVTTGAPLCQLAQDDSAPTFTLLFDVRYAGNPIDPRRLLK